jgi:shikimate 5-dehydrogenase
MREIREAGNTSWVIVDGLEVVAEMAMESFELLTGRNAPKSLMRTVCNENWEKHFAPFEASH